MPKIPINGPLSLSQNIPNVDGRFGPYTSVAEANEYLGPAVNPTDEYDDVISAGMLFGIYEDDGSVTICMWTKDHATVNDFKRISHAQIVQFNGIVTGAVTINQSSGATAKTASDIKYLQQNKKFGYLQGSGYIVNWVNRYIWADSSQNPYQDVLYLNIATNALYYYTGTALVALTAGSQGSLVTSVNGQTGAVTITIPTKLSDLTNDVGFITNAGVTSFNGQTGAVTYTPPVTSVNNKTGAVVLDKTDVGLGNVDNTPDANKQVYSAVHDGSGNPIDETYETKTHATAQHSLLQSNIDSLANVAANLTGLEGTNFGGFSLASDAATAVSNIPTVFTQNGCTVGQPYWFLAGADMSALVAYRYIGSGTPAAISATEYDFTDFSGLSERVKDFKGTITTLSAIDDLHNVADVGVYHVKVSQFSGLLIVEKFNDGLNTTITQQLIASGTPVNQGGSYTIEKGQTLARRAYSGSAWTSWTDPIAELQANVAALGPEINKAKVKNENNESVNNPLSFVTNKEYIFALVDANKRFLFGIKTDGKIEWSVGIPTPLANIVDTKVDKISGKGLSTNDFTTSLKEKLEDIDLSEKVDKEDGKSLVNSTFASGISIEANPEYMMVVVDQSKHVVFGIKNNGSVYWPIGVPNVIKSYVEQNLITAPQISSLISSAITAYDANFVTKATNVFNSLYPEATQDVFSLIGSKKECEVKLRNLRLCNMKRNDLTNSTGEKLFTLLHFTDNHDNDDNLAYICDFIDEFQSLLDVAICTGDITSVTNANMPSRYDEFADKFLLAIGNHDASAQLTNGIYYMNSAAVYYDKFLAAHIDNWGVTQGGTKKCYYYKDFASGITGVNGVRLIVLDDYDNDEDLVYTQNAPNSVKALPLTVQKAWLASVLNDAITNNLSVVVAQHDPAGAHDKVINSTFTNPDGVVTYGDPRFVSTIGDFIDNGGDFVCWLTGHIHSDDFEVSHQDNRQIDINVGCSLYKKATTLDGAMIKDSSSQILFNVISVDPQEKILKIQRFGRNSDRFLRTKNTLILNYSTKQIISNN